MNSLKELGLYNSTTIIMVVIALIGEFLFYYFIVKFIVNAFRRSRNHIFFKNNVVRNVSTNEIVGKDNKINKNVGSSCLKCCSNI